jgi:hypothetical protein
MSLLPFYSVEASREERLYSLLRRLNYLHPFCIGLLTYMFTCVLTDIEAAKSYNFEIYQLVFLVSSPYVFCCVLGLLLRFENSNANNRATSVSSDSLGLAINKQEERRVRKYDRLFVCLVTKGVNKDAVYRTWDSLKSLLDMTRSIYVYVVSDEPFHFDDLNNIVVPNTFECKNARVSSL